MSFLKSYWAWTVAGPTWKKIAGISGPILLVLIILSVVFGGNEEDGNGTTAATDVTESGLTEAPAVASSVRATTAPEASATAEPPTAPPAPTAIPTPAFFTFGDGVYVVGADVPPGTYRTRTGSPFLCYWARLSGFGGTLGEILYNELESGPSVVTIAEGDVGFETSDCAEWTEDLSPITAGLEEPFSDGTFIVGTDISSGTWRSEGSANLCYWARLAGFTGDLNDIIANDLPSGPAIVTISESDAGFQTGDCGTWTKLE